MKESSTTRIARQSSLSASKRISLAALTCMLALSAQAQNPTKHIANTANNSIDYMSGSNEYLLSGNALQVSIAGMNNKPGSWVLPRVQLEVISDNMTHVMYKTYCTVTEVNDYLQHTCPTLSVAFFNKEARQTADGGFIVCGHTMRTSETSNCPGPSYDESYLIRLNSSGAVVWYKRYQVSNNAGARFNSVIEDRTTGNILVCGKDASARAFVMGTNASGVPVWSYKVNGKFYGTDSAIVSEYTRIAPYNDPGNPQQQYYVLTGTAGNALNIAQMPNFGGGLLTTVDATGAVFQNVELTEDPYFRFMHLNGVADAYDGDVVLTGFSGGRSCGAHDGWNLLIMKINPLNLTQNFMRVYQTNASNPNVVSGGVSITHNTASGGNIFVTGTESDGSALGGRFGIYVETDNNGNVQRYNQHAGSTSTGGAGIIYNYNNGYPVYSGLAPSPTSFIVKNNYGFDCQDDVSTEMADLNSDAIDNLIDPVTVPYVSDNLIDFDIKDPISTVCGYSSKAAPTAVGSTNGEKLITLIPNPAQSHLDVQLPGSASAGMVNVYDIQGRTVLSQAFKTSSGAVHLSVNKLTPGMYTIAVESEGAILRSRFIKQ